MLTSINVSSLTPEERELALDLLQLSLDLVGIFEPTPFADLSSALISVGRDDWIGAGLSGLGIIPYIGDLAKMGKLERYIGTINRAVMLAKTNPAFAAAVRPVLTRIMDLLNSIPVDRLSGSVGSMVEKLRRAVSGMPGTTRVVRRAASTIDDLADELLLVKKGSLVNVGTQVRERARLIAEFFHAAGVPPAKMHEWMSGIDLSKPVRVTKLGPDEVLGQYVQGGSVGAWFVRLGSGVGPDAIGLGRGVRVLDPDYAFRPKGPVQALESYAETINDSWTRYGAGVGSYQRAPRTKVGIDQKTGSVVFDVSPVPRYSQSARGGGQQLLIPNKGHWTDLFERVPRRNAPAGRVR